jgi:GT2 family glycosyltransferase
MTRTLTIQTVRFGTDLVDLRRSVTSIGHALGVARENGLHGDVVVAHGDASPESLDEGARNELSALGEKFGFTYYYEYFNENTGTARGQNRLARALPATWQFVTNPDVVFGGTCLAQMWRRTSEARVGLIEARQLPLEKMRDYDPITGVTSWADGSCTLVRGDLWRTLDGYDETFFLYGDDVDMSWRARLAGFDVVHVSAARVFHDKRVGTSRHDVMAAHEVHYSALASYLMARKWGTAHDVARVRENIVGAEYAEVRRVVAEMDELGTYPQPVAGAERVAEFSDVGTFGRFRS